jgi:hypothetical protein
MALLLVFPLFSVTASHDTISVTGTLDSHGFAITELPTVDADGMTYEANEPIRIPIYLVFISLCLLTAASIMLYKKRKRQLLFCRLNFILHILVVIAFYTFYYLGQPFLTEAMQSEELVKVDVKFTMEVGFYLLIPTIPFLFLAIRGIKSDQKLLASIDRIR